MNDRCLTVGELREILAREDIPDSLPVATLYGMLAPGGAQTLSMSQTRAAVVSLSYDPFRPGDSQKPLALLLGPLVEDARGGSVTLSQAPIQVMKGPW